MRRILINAYTIDYTMIFNYNQGPRGHFELKLVILIILYNRLFYDTRTVALEKIQRLTMTP